VNTALERLSAALAERYRIERPLGQGGMATVYLAADLKHDRRVAIKVLKPELAAVLGAERFVQEIKTTAALSHPHILPLFDSGEADGFLYYVMPYIEGETIRDRLNRENQLGVDEAVRITCEIADALDYAHRHGVIHRDIKPENLLLHDGRAMVMDFGIALAVSAAAGGRMTETGLSLGTPHYMSPEQATADRDISARSDIYSLASVCYEMLAGDPPHTASSAQAIIMKIVTEVAPPVTTRRKSVPPHVADALATALEKLPADRFATAADFVAALKGTTASTRLTSAGSRASAAKPGRERLLAAALALSIIAAGIGWTRRTPEPAPSRQQVVLWRHAFPEAMAPGATLLATQAAIAPDGSAIVFVDSTPQGYVLMRKLRGSPEATPIAGTEGGVTPFFSPDGAWVAFLTVDGKVRKVPIAGGGVITLASDVNVDWKAGAWADDGGIYYVSNGNRLARQDASDASIPQQLFGGILNVGTWSTMSLTPLPGSRGIIAAICPGNCAVTSAVHVFDFRRDSSWLLLPGATGAWYAPTGHLLYTGREGGLFAVGFDANKLAVTSSATPLIADVAPGRFTLSASGDALYSVGASMRGNSELVWVDRTGRSTPFDSTWRAHFEYPAVSPDGRTVAVSARAEVTELWLRRPNGAREKIDAPGTANWRPHWTPDGDTLYFVSIGANDLNDPVIRKLPVDFSADAELVFDGPNGLWEVETTPDGRYLIIRADEEGGDSNIRYRAMSGDTTLRALVVDPGQTTTIALSPDGRWLAYTSDDGSGVRYNIYVAPFPAMSPRRLVSREGGIEPRWSRDGRELFFKSSTQMMSVSLGSGATLEVGNPRPLFSLEGYRSARNRQQYDVAPDGRFLMIRDPQSTQAAPVVYAQGLLTELLAKVR
jgi:eukaryotic-like serine/threonine-protein kinase